MRQPALAPLLTRYGRKIAFVAKQIVDDEHARFVDALLNRLIATEGLLIEWERKRTRNLCRVLVVGVRSWVIMF